MDCDRMREVLIEHVDGLLGSEEADDARSHLAACAPCRVLQEEVRRNFAALDCWEDEDLPEGAFERLLARVPSGPSVRPASGAPAAPRRTWIRVLVPYAAGLATAAAAMAFFVLPRDGATPPAGPAVPVPAESPVARRAPDLKPGERPLEFRVADEGVVRRFLLPEGVDPQNLLLIDVERPIPVPSGVR